MKHRLVPDSHDPVEATPTYVRRARTGPLSFSTKLYQGIGAIPDTVKNGTFNTFILLYYNQILGVDPTLVSIALAVAIIFDAITDPMVASLSDNLTTRWVRPPSADADRRCAARRSQCAMAPPAA